MGFSNPQARKGFAGASNPLITARDQGGGDAKAGLGQHIGMGQFTYAAIFNGAAGHKAPTVAGPYYPALGALGLVPQAKDLLQRPIVAPNGANLYYPISFNNILGANVGRGPRQGGQFGASSDGVNLITRRQMANQVASWNRFWPARPVRWTYPPPIPPNPAGVAPGKPLPNWPGLVLY